MRACCATSCRVMLCCAGDMTGGRWGPFWDKLVFSKIRERVGGEVKYMTTGRTLADVSYFGLVCFQEFTIYIYISLILLYSNFPLLVADDFPLLVISFLVLVGSVWVGRYMTTGRRLVGTRPLCLVPSPFTKHRQSGLHYGRIMVHISQ